jgi:glyoxylase-like metal-dependent hydrolase (beta-lactamase superfamily II)
MPDRAIDATTGYYDVRYHDHERLIATAVLNTDAGPVLVDPGPTVSIDGLKKGLAADGYGWGDVHALLLTHIHLDHAGATGTIAARVAEAGGRAEVYVHERGAPHLVRPERLLRSARRIYGGDMDRLWGAFEAVPEAAVRPLQGGERLEVGGRALRVAYTPGHAQHHVSYLDVASGTALVGDVAGMRVAGADVILPVAPPPDVDLPAWRESLERVRAWAPDRLLLTHFGAHADVDAHLDRMRERLEATAEAVRASLRDGPRSEGARSKGVRSEGAGRKRADAERAEAFARQELDHVRVHVEDETSRSAYERFGQPRESWHGLARYWRTRSAAAPETP